MGYDNTVGVVDGRSSRVWGSQQEREREKVTKSEREGWGRNILLELQMVRVVECGGGVG